MAGYPYPSPAGGEGNDESLREFLVKRVRWRCRRGLLELDIVLGRFVGTQYASLNEAEREAFEVLLDMPDNSFWDMISGRMEAASDEQQALLEKIRAA